MGVSHRLKKKKVGLTGEEEKRKYVARSATRFFACDTIALWMTSTVLRCLPRSSNRTHSTTVDLLPITRRSFNAVLSFLSAQAEIVLSILDAVYTYSTTCQQGLRGRYHARPSTKAIFSWCRSSCSSRYG